MVVTSVNMSPLFSTWESNGIWRELHKLVLKFEESSNTKEVTRQWKPVPYTPYENLSGAFWNAWLSKFDEIYEVIDIQKDLENNESYVMLNETKNILNDKRKRNYKKWSVNSMHTR